SLSARKLTEVDDAFELPVPFPPSQALSCRFELKEQVAACDTVVGVELAVDVCGADLLCQLVPPPLVLLHSVQRVRLAVLECLWARTHVGPMRARTRPPRRYGAMRGVRTAVMSTSRSENISCTVPSRVTAPMWVDAHAFGPTPRGAGWSSAVR